jgi:ribosomal protein L37AE/L43A
MKQNPLTEHCEQCGSANISRVERSMSVWEVLAMVPRALGFLSPAFFSLSMRATPRQKGQDQRYRCLRCNRTWQVIRERTAT